MKFIFAISLLLIYYECVKSNYLDGEVSKTEDSYNNFFNAAHNKEYKHSEVDTHEENWKVIDQYVTRTIATIKGKLRQDNLNTINLKFTIPASIIFDMIPGINLKVAPLKLTDVLTLDHYREEVSKAYYENKVVHVKPWFKFNQLIFTYTVEIGALFTNFKLFVTQIELTNVIAYATGDIDVENLIAHISKVQFTKCDIMNVKILTGNGLMDKFISYVINTLKLVNKNFVLQTVSQQFQQILKTGVSKLAP